MRASCRRRRVARRFGNVESARVGKANRAADVSIAAHLLPQRSAPARRGARSAEAVVRASADMLAGNGGGEPRERSCASVWSRISRTEKVSARSTYRVSTRVLRGSQSWQSQTSTFGDFLAIRGAETTSASFRHTPRAPYERETQISFQLLQRLAVAHSRATTNERTNERYLCYSHTVTPPPQTLNQNHHLTHGQKCWQSACASSAVTHDACLAGCW